MTASCYRDALAMLLRGLYTGMGCAVVVQNTAGVAARPRSEGRASAGTQRERKDGWGVESSKGKSDHRRSRATLWHGAAGCVVDGEEQDWRWVSRRGRRMHAGLIEGPLGVD